MGPDLSAGAWPVPGHPTLYAGNAGWLPSGGERYAAQRSLSKRLTNSGLGARVGVWPRGSAESGKDLGMDERQWALDRADLVARTAWTPRLEELCVQAATHGTGPDELMIVRACVAQLLADGADLSVIEELAENGTL